jgi:thiamine-monophosphate kinase
MKRSSVAGREMSAARMGEHGVIQFMRSFFDPMPKVPVPLGDDVSAVPLVIGEGDVAVLKADMLVGKTDVPRGMSLWQATRKAVVMNVSDFAAKGVQPQAILVSLGLPKRLMRKDLEEIAKGLNAGAREYDAYIIGGDTGEASDLIVSVHLFGTSSQEELMRRKGAKPGDILAVTGFFGRSAGGLHLLVEGGDASPALRETLVSAVCMPKARLKEGLALRRSRAVTSAMDSSDGLAWCLHELAEQSGVGFSVTSLPVDLEVVRFAKFNGLDIIELALYGGEEYELVMTIDPKNWEKAESAVAAVGGKLLPIGKATRDRQILLSWDDGKLEVEPRGYEHFRS